MYGLVNKAIRDMVCSQCGEETWQRIRSRAEVVEDRFLSMESYPDDLTHRLVLAASQELGLPPTQIMEKFGEYWVHYTGQEGYGEMMALAGDTLPEFLGNLDELHARVGVSFPQLQPPQFDCEAADEQELTLHYHSRRQGLAPMVIGLVQGLGDRFDTEVDVTQTAHRESGADHDIFRIRYQERGNGDRS